MPDEYKALVARLKNEVCFFSELDWQDHVALAREAAKAIERLEVSRELWRLTAKEVTDELLGITADMERYKAALGAIGAIGNGYCFCFGKIRDWEQPDDWHLPECRDARKALQETD